MAKKAGPLSDLPIGLEFLHREVDEFKIVRIMEEEDRSVYQVGNANLVKGVQCSFDVRGARTDRTLTEFRCVALDVFHDIAMLQHVEISDALGGMEYVRNPTATEGMGNVPAQEWGLRHTVISFAFREKGFSAPFIVLWAGQSLTDVRRMFAAREQLVCELAPGRSENVSVDPGRSQVFGPKY